MIVSLPYPAKILWPNGRTRSHRWKASEVKKHKRWAYLAALEADTGEQFINPVEVRLRVCAHPRGPLPDQDNCIAAAKAYLDGIADAIGINDNCFTAPIVTFGRREARFVIEVVA